MYKIALAWIAAALVFSSPVQAADTTKPTIVLVHGAFADGGSWNGVIKSLTKDGFRTVAVANPLRGVKSDAGYLFSIIDSIKTPVVLVGHSYGGSVISVAAAGHTNVKSLVFVSAFAPDTGEFSRNTFRQVPREFPGIGSGRACWIGRGRIGSFISIRRSFISSSHTTFPATKRR